MEELLRRVLERIKREGLEEFIVYLEHDTLMFKGRPEDMKVWRQIALEEGLELVKG